MQDILSAAKQNLENKKLEEAAELDKKKKEAEEKNEFPDLTPEQEEAIFRKRFGVGSDQLIKKEEQIVVLSEEEKEKIRKEKEANVLAEGLKNGWFTKEQYDTYQQIVSEDDFSKARKKFIKDNPELENADELFDDIFAVNEESEIEETDEFEGAVKKENVKKKATSALAQKMAEQFLKENYGEIIGASERFEQQENKKAQFEKNKQEVNSAISSIPKEIDIELEGEVYKIAVDNDDIDFVKTTFLADNILMGSKNISQSDVLGSAILAIKSKNFEKIIKTITDINVAKAVDKAERGSKGLPDRSKDGVVTEEVSEGRKIVDNILNSKK